MAAVDDPLPILVSHNQLARARQRARRTVHSKTKDQK